MEIKRGQVVKSIAGHDKGGFLTVLEVDPPCVLVCDGKRRPLERPKRKKLFHVAPTATLLPEEALQTNRQIRTALRLYEEERRQQSETGTESASPERYGD